MLKENYTKRELEAFTQELTSIHNSVLKKDYTFKKTRGVQTGAFKLVSIFNRLIEHGFILELEPAIVHRDSQLRTARHLLKFKQERGDSARELAFASDDVNSLEVLHGRYIKPDSDRGDGWFFSEITGREVSSWAHQLINSIEWGPGLDSEGNLIKNKFY